MDSKNVAIVSSGDTQDELKTSVENAYKNIKFATNLDEAFSDVVSD